MENFVDFSDDLIPLEFEVNEAVSDQKGVLGRFGGQFFVPDGESRNKRWYTESLWRKVLKQDRVQESLKSGGMLGTLCHPTDEKWKHPFYSSHVVKKLWIDNNKRGMGEAYMLDTPVGRVCNTFSKSGLVKLYVSSRAYGKYEEGRKHKGMPIVDEDNYIFHTFDIVLEPGFLEAAPKFEGVRASFGKELQTLSECYLDTERFKLPKAVRESETTKLLRDLDFILGGLK